MNILVTLNSGYLRQLTVMLYSLLKSHPKDCVSVYVLHNSLTDSDFAKLRKISPMRMQVFSITIPEGFLSNAPTSGRYPVEMYYRIFAAQLLPNTLSRILYLDPDLVVINNLHALYNIDFGNCLFAAASHLSSKSRLNRVNKLRLSMPQGSSYVNSGVMMMNLVRLRREQNADEVFQYIEEHKLSLVLPDQDVLNAVYSDRILTVDFLRYNLSERCLKLYNMRYKNWKNPLNIDWVAQNTAIIHYCGRNKPWKSNYFGILDSFYLQLEQQAKTEGLI